MVSRLPEIDEDGEVGDLSEVDPSLFRPAREVLPLAFQELVGLRTRGPQKAPTKVPTTIRFDADTLAALKATGSGWQTRVNDAMREWVRARAVV
jgi:uncharacterized protein (DUF4415 family)